MDKKLPLQNPAVISRGSIPLSDLLILVIKVVSANSHFWNQHASSILSHVTPSALIFLTLPSQRFMRQGNGPIKNNPENNCLALKMPKKIACREWPFQHNFHSVRHFKRFTHL